MHGIASPDERSAWHDTQKHISAVLNVLLSMGAIAAAVWWGAGSAGPIWVRLCVFTKSQKVSVALGLSLLIGTAEVVLYSRVVRSAQRRRTKAAH